MDMATTPVDVDRLLATLDVPTGSDPVTLDVRELGPPKPLSETLERLTTLESGVVLVQLNDRVPQHLYPRLEDRGFEFETIEREDVVVTVIWHGA